MLQRRAAAVAALYDPESEAVDQGALSALRPTIRAAELSEANMTAIYDFTVRDIAGREAAASPTIAARRC